MKLKQEKILLINYLKIMKIKVIGMSLIALAVSSLVIYVNAQSTEVSDLERYNSSTIETLLDAAYIPNPSEENRNGIILEQLSWDKENLPQEQEESISPSVSVTSNKKDVPQVQPVVAQSSSISHSSYLPGLADYYNTYKSYYESVDGCHPYILAGIHYRETTFGNTNAWNGQGAFQNINNRYTPNSVVIDWEAQAQQACDHLRQPYGWAFMTDLNNQELIGKALASYNGCMGEPYNQCGYAVNQTNIMSYDWKCSVDFTCHPLVKDNKYGALSIVSQLQSLGL